jgi:hypothetical protein
MDENYVENDYEREKLFGVVVSSSASNRECRK